MNYTEEDLRKAFQAGQRFGAWLGDRSYTNDENIDEEDYINNLNKSVVEEDKISFSYSFLRRKLEWEQFCDLTGVNYYAKNEGYEIKDSEIFEITESKAKQYNLI